MTTRFILSATLAVAPVLCQETTTSTASPLVITTNDLDIAYGALESFESEAEMPELGAGAVAILTMDDGGQLGVRKGAGDVYLKIEARPDQLMEIFANDVAQAKGMATMFGGMAMQQQGMDAKMVNDMVEGAFAFPKQIGMLTLVIPEHPETKNALDLTLSMTGVADSWFGKMIADTNPLKGGIRRIDAGDAMMSLDVNVDMAKLVDDLRPFTETFGTMGQETKEEKAQAIEMSNKFYAAMTGAMSMVMSPDGARALIGLADPAGLKTLLSADEYLAVSRRATEATGMAEAKINPKAMTHREVDVVETTVEYDDPSAMPMAEDGVMKSYSAVAGKSMVMTMLGKNAKSDIKNMIDFAMEQDVKKADLGAGVVARCSIDLVSFFDWFSQMAPVNASFDGDEPERLDITLTKSQNALVLKLGAK